MKLEVLVVDDEKYMGRLIDRLLRGKAQVSTATSARQALELVQRRDFDVIFCDLNMPVVSGIGFYRALSEQKPGSEEHVVFLTGGVVEGSGAGFFDEVDNPLVLKPFSIADLQEAIDQVAAGAGGGEGQ